MIKTMASMEIEASHSFEDSGGGYPGMEFSTPPLFRKMSLNKTSTPLMKQTTWRNPARVAGRHLLDDSEALGSPSYPSPLDRIRSTRSRRHGGFSSPPPANLSLPLSPSLSADSRRHLLDKFKGDGLNSFSFSPSHSKGSFHPVVDASHTISLNGSWAFYNYVGERKGGNLLVRNPNKAVVTINTRTTEILVANKMASLLLQLPASQLVGRSLSEYFASPREQLALSETELESSGKLVVISGKVMELMTPEGAVVPVSVWIRRLTPSRCLVVMEPVERTTATCDLDPQGFIMGCDPNLALLFGLPTQDELLSSHVSKWIPALVLPSDPTYVPQVLAEQTATGRMKDGASFPLTVALKLVGTVLNCTMSVFTNISGLITLLPDGSIHSCNTNFSQMLFGFSQDQLVGKPITTIIPTFYEDLEYLVNDSLPLPTLDDDDDELIIACAEGDNCQSGVEPVEDCCETEAVRRPENPLGRLCLDDTMDMLQGLCIEHKEDVLVPQSPVESPTPILEGGTCSLGRHKDGSDIEIVYQVKRVELDQKTLFCLWVSRDVARPKPHDSSVHFRPEECDAGPYSDHYTTLKQIGKGAFGCVKMSCRNSDGLLAITKFICKKKVYEDAWVTDPTSSQRVPIEVRLLTSLSHPNIVRVLDVFENEHFYQVVMEKHGAGMDMFEFIDRSPHVDEGLASYMFRQVVSALTYLHSCGILHRDVKDENIILDQNFHVKLIDFGSAAVMEPGKIFTIFCGTLVYCSPEVLRGEGYRGPELEMWALGVTLYTLVFGESPWQDVDETMAAVLPHPPPALVSADLWDLLKFMLHPDPDVRCSLRDCAAHPWTNLPVEPSSYRLQDVINAEPGEVSPPQFYHQMVFPK